MNIKSLLLIICTLIGGFIHTSMADAKPASPDDIKRIMDYWNGLTSIKADIEQSNDGANPLTGTLWLKKGPGKKAKLRVEYHSKKQHHLLIKDNEVLLVDPKDNAVSAYPIGMTPADLILKPNLKLGTDVIVVDSLQLGNEIQLVLARDKDDTSATLTLFFTLKPGIQLLRWKVVEPQGNITQVDLIKDSVRINDPATVPDSVF